MQEYVALVPVKPPAQGKSRLVGLPDDLRRELGVWLRDHRSDPKSAEVWLSAAVASQPEPETLRMLAELRRREPGRPLVETLLLLAEVTPDDLLVLHEAASVARLTVDDPDLAQPILERARRMAGAELERIARDTAELIGLGRDLRDDELILLGDWAGDAYGIPVGSTIDAIHITAELEGVILDPVYEGKSMAGLIDLVRTGEIGKGSNVLYAHLGGQLALNAYSGVL